MKYPPYPRYKDSGIGWLGEIPEHWQVTRLRYLCRITTGNRNTEDSIENGEYPFFVRSQEVERINSYSFDGEAILTAGDGVGVGKVFHHYKGKLDFHQRVYLLSNFHSINGKLLFHFIKANFYKIVLEGNAKSTVDSLRLPMFQDFSIAYSSSIDEQNNIVEYLDQETLKIGELIGKQEQLIALLKEKRQALISHAVTKGLNPNVPRKDSGIAWLGEIPKHWEAIPFRTAFNTIYRYPTYFDIPYTDQSGVIEIRGEALGNNGQIILLEDTRYISKETNNKFPRTQLLEGDFVISVRGTLGKIGLVTKDFAGSNITANLLRLSPVDKLYESQFLKWLFLSEFFQIYLEQFSSQTTIKTVTIPQLAQIRLILLPRDEQREIVKYLDRETAKIDALMEKARRAIELLQEHRTALISSAVTGKIDVRNNSHGNLSHH